MEDFPSSSSAVCIFLIGMEESSVVPDRCFSCLLAASGVRTRGVGHDGRLSLSIKADTVADCDEPADV